MNSASDQDLREQALARIKKKREFMGHLLAYVLVNGLLVGIWAATGAGFFWPVFPLLGWGIGLVFHALDVYREPPSEAEITREMNRLRRSR
jgi:hypothetical protein